MEDRHTVMYFCDHGHRTPRSFALDVAIPEVWECTCGRLAGVDSTAPPLQPSLIPFRTHLEYVQLRRDPAEADALLEAALAARAERLGYPAQCLPPELRGGSIIAVA